MKFKNRFVSDLVLHSFFGPIKIRIRNSFLHQILPFLSSTMTVERSVNSCKVGVRACFYETHLVKVQSDNDVRFLCLFVNSFEEIHMTDVYMGQIIKANTQIYNQSILNRFPQILLKNFLDVFKRQV